MSSIMTDQEKIAALRELDEAATHATKVANGMIRGLERAANARLFAAYQRIAADWLGRRLTEREVAD